MMNKWNLVSENLPKQNGEYLCVEPCCYGKITSSSIRILGFATNLKKIDDYEFKGKKHAGFYDYDSEWGYCEWKDITHWMNLPELPEIEETEVKDNA